LPLIVSAFTSSVVDNKGSYIVKWNIISSSSIDLYISIKTTSFQPTWIGFGFPESGSMPGADIVTVESLNSMIVVTDRYVPWVADPLTGSPQPYPLADTIQDWSMKCASSTTTTLTAVLHRALNTYDNQDRPIVAGPMPVIAAWGGGPNGMGYHGPNRVSSSISFYGDGNDSETFFIPTDTTSELQLSFDPAWSVQPIVTQYICQVVDLGTDTRHATAFLANYDTTPGGPFVHHVTVHQCGNKLMDLLKARLYTTPFPCRTSDPKAEGDSPLGTVCPSIIFIRDVGGGGLDLPMDVGFLLGGGGPRFLVVEAHINNPSMSSGTLISKLVRVSLTSTLRQHNAGVLSVGTAYWRSLAAGQSQVCLQAACSRQKTASFQGTIHVFLSLLHMHRVGKQAWSTKYTYASPAPSLSNITSKVVFDYRAFWNFGFQTYSSVSLTISPGDQINTHCVYDTSKRTSPVYFGQSSSNEMCFNFLFFYPLEHANGGGLCHDMKAAIYDADSSLPASIPAFGVSGSPSWTAAPSVSPTSTPTPPPTTPTPTPPVLSDQPSGAPVSKPTTTSPSPTMSTTTSTTTSTVFSSYIRGGGAESAAHAHLLYGLLVLVLVAALTLSLVGWLHRRPASPRPPALQTAKEATASSIECPFETPDHIDHIDGSEEALIERKG